MTTSTTSCTPAEEEENVFITQIQAIEILLGLQVQGLMLGYYHLFFCFEPPIFTVCVVPVFVNNM
jgi:hypothetical protein